MNNENMMQMNLANLEMDCNIEAPVGMFFELFAVMPNMIEQFGISKSREEYLTMLSDVKSDYENIENFSWDTASADEQHFYKRCQVVSMLGAHLEGIPMMIRLEGSSDWMAVAC